MTVASIDVEPSKELAGQAALVRIDAEARSKASNK